MVIDLTPARVNADAPRSSVSRAARAASTLGDHNRTIAGRPLIAATERASPGRSGTATSGAGNGSYHPGGPWRRHGSGGRRRDRSRRSRLEGLALDATPFDDANAGVQGDVGEHLRVARGPEDRELRKTVARAQTDHQLLRMLREESGPALQDAGLVDTIGLDRHPRADRVSVAPGPHQAQGDRRRPRLEVVSEDAKLRRLPGGHHYEIRIALAVDVEDRERPAILVEIEADRSGDLVVPPCPSLRRNTLRWWLAIEP